MIGAQEEALRTALELAINVETEAGTKRCLRLIEYLCVGLEVEAIERMQAELDGRLEALRALQDTSALADYLHASIRRRILGLAIKGES